MVVDLKLCRFEDAPWGFRLIGGADFEYPLTVVKVAEGSLAEQAGMKVGDVIVRINDELAINLSHTDAHKIISHCGNNFFLGVVREGEDKSTTNDEEQNNVHQYEESHHPTAYSPDSLIESCGKSPVSEITEKQNLEITTSIAETTQKSEIEKITEVEIAELISSEAEVLKEHNVIGVNFNRIFPKAEVCQNSEVFRTLNSEAAKTKVEIEKDKRKWTTFLQKPDRPIPKSKHEIEQEHIRIPYKVQIVKQPQPKLAPGRPSTPPPEPEPVIEPPKEEPLPTDSEVPNLEPIISANIEQIVIENQDHFTSSEYIENQEMITIETSQYLNNRELIIHEQPTIDIPQKTEEELRLEKQLAAVQKQLLALATLPSTIQATLDSVTKQLTELLPSFRLQPLSSESNTNPEDENVIDIKHITEQLECAEIYGKELRNLNNFPIETFPIIEENAEKNAQTIETTEENQIDLNENVAESGKELSEIEESNILPHEHTTELDIEKIRWEEEQEELNYKKQKEQDKLDEEHQQRLIRLERLKRPARTFGPLTPQERPLVLPGGRKWRKPKDAYNDEFIAEILSSQAELIVGTTLGVNFLKYQKPEKKIDLEKSEVYKIVHHLETEPRRGIEVRPPKVLAESDVRNCATPISCS